MGTHPIFESDFDCLTDMHILVGGGTGFIGKHLSAYLRQRGHKVTAISRFEGENRITWQQLRWGEAPKDVDAIVNLAGNRFMDIRFGQTTLFNSSSLVLLRDFRRLGGLLLNYVKCFVKKEPLKEIQ